MWRYDFAYENGAGHPRSSDYYNRLSSVSFTCGGVRYNPTQIMWGERPECISNINYPNCHNMYITAASFLEPHGNLQNNLKFSGDFNGDGLSDVIVVGTVENKSKESVGKNTQIDSTETNRDPVNREMRVYLNEGNTKEDGLPGVTCFSNAQHNLYTSPSYVYMLSDIDWIHVCDFNGDGMDDIVAFGEHYGFFRKTVTVYAFKSVILSDGTWDLRLVLFNNNTVSLHWPVAKNAVIDWRFLWKREG